jgi:Kef-type K+ transport system membrane component KefB
MVAIFLIIIWLLNARLARWVTEKPSQPALITAVALMAGGSYFVYYWGVSLVYHLGSWGFKLGLYS